MNKNKNLVRENSIPAGEGDVLSEQELDAHVTVVMTKGRQKEYRDLWNYFVGDASLSMEAKGIMLTILSLENEGEVTEEEIRKHIAKSDQPILTRILKELVDHGYLELDEVEIDEEEEK